MTFPVSLWLPPLFSFVVTLLLVHGAIKLFPRIKLLDRPGEYGLHRSPIPYSGGVVFYIVFIAAIFIFLRPLTPTVLGLVIAATIVVVTSFLDDRYKLNPWLRLGMQVLTACIIIISGVKIQLLSNPFGAPFFLDTITFTFAGQEIWLFSGLLILAWLILMMNVTNWLDGIPGQAAGITVIAQSALFILALRPFNVVDQTAVLVLSSVIASASLVFLFFDFPPPKILMGDTGSMFLGLLLGTLAILSGGKLATALLIMGFPVLDAFVVIIRRILKGGSPVRGDYSHLHHRLLHAGFSEKKALFFNYFFCAAFAAVAVFLKNTLYKFIIFGIIAFLLALILVIITLHGSRRRD